MKKKGLVIGIVVLFLGMAFMSSAGSLSVEKSVLADNYIQNSNLDDEPVIDVTWNVYKEDGKWYVHFDCEMYGGGITRAVWYLNGKEMDIVVGPGPVYEFHFTIGLSKAKESVFKFEAICGSESFFVEVDGSDINSHGADVTWELFKKDGKWHVSFICDPGMDFVDRVTMYVDDVEIGTATGPGPLYIFTTKWSKSLRSCTFKFVFHYGVGDQVAVIIKGSDIKSCSSSQQSTQQSSLILNNLNVMSVTPTIERANFVDDTTPPVTTIDFDPCTPDGDNDWYTDYVEACLHAMDDLSGVKTIYYRVDGGEWKNHNGEYLYFIVDESGEHVVEYYSIDNAGNMEDVKSATFKMDLEKPIAKCDWSQISKYKFKFTIDASDETSGINRVEFWWDDEYQYTDYEPPYEWILEISDGNDVAKQDFIYPFYVFDNAGLVTQPVGRNSICKNIHNILNQQSTQQSSTGSNNQNVMSIIPSVENALFLDDTTPPEIDVSWETYKVDGKWYVYFDCEFYDEESGINRAVWYLNGVEQSVIVGSGPEPFEFHFTIELSEAKESVFKFEAINGAGLSAFVEVDGSDINSYSLSQQFTNTLFLQILQQLMNIK